MGAVRRQWPPGGSLAANAQLGDHQPSGSVIKGRSSTRSRQLNDSPGRAVDATFDFHQSIRYVKNHPLMDGNMTLSDLRSIQPNTSAPPRRGHVHGGGGSFTKVRREAAAIECGQKHRRLSAMARGLQDWVD